MSFNPITAAFAARVESVCGPVRERYDASRLRKMGYLQGLKELWGIKAAVLVLAIEGEAGRALIGPLSVAALLTRARSIKVVWPDLQVEALPRRTSMLNLLRIGRDTFLSRRALSRSKSVAEELAKEGPRRDAPPASGRHVLYLDANISLGTTVGGSVGHTGGVIEGLIDHGFAVDYASMKPLPTARPGARWLRLAPGTMLALPPELIFYRYAERIKEKITGLHSENPWSFVYQRFSLHNFLGPWLGRLLNIPVVVEFNGSEAWAAENWGTPLVLHEEALAAERVALTQADLIVAVSDQLVRELRRYDIPDERILAYPNCVDPAVFDPARFSRPERDALRARYGIPADAFVIGFIGTFGQWHGVDFLAHCIEELVSEQRSWIDRYKIHFLIVGDGPKMPAVRQALDPAPVRNYVRLTGLVAQTEAPKHLACADLLVAPHVPNADGSEFFGSPTKLFEYMSMERPILAAALGQIADVVSGRGAGRFVRLPAGRNRPCGLLYEPGNRTAFKEELRRLMENPALAASLAQAARAEVLARYTWKHHVTAILERMAELNLLREMQRRVTLDSPVRPG